MVIGIVIAVIIVCKNLGESSYNTNNYSRSSETDEEIEKKKAELQMQQYLDLIGKCGAKFFIKYYRQIQSLLFDQIKISESYSPPSEWRGWVPLKKFSILACRNLHCQK